jgi:5-methylcytosine-specific restriction enzyme A
VPYAPKRPCTCPGCNTLTDAGRCVNHKRIERNQIDARRGTAHSRGYDANWRRARTRYLAEHPLCTACYKSGRVVIATVVDHIRAHKGDRLLFWDQDNWQSLCKQHHDQKTAKEDGAWGRGIEIAVQNQ